MKNLVLLFLGIPLSFCLGIVIPVIVALSWGLLFVDVVPKIVDIRTANIAANNQLVHPKPNPFKIKVEREDGTFFNTESSWFYKAQELVKMGQLEDKRRAKYADRNCSDFRSSKDATDFVRQEYKRVRLYDTHVLDPNRNGIACEALSK